MVFAQGIALSVTQQLLCTQGDAVDRAFVPRRARANVTTIALGATHGLGILRGGLVVAWGQDNSRGQVSVPVEVRRRVAVAVAAGAAHSLALLSPEGRVVGWGANDALQARAVPDAWHNVTAIAAGDWHSLALKADGSVVGWGEPSYGQMKPPASLRGHRVVALACGALHSLVLLTNGTVVAFGDNRAGQSAVPAAARAGVKAIAAGSFHRCAFALRACRCTKTCLRRRAS